MRRDICLIVPFVVALALVLAGCSPSYVITQDLDGSLRQPRSFRVGDLEDRLPAEVALADRPTAEDVEKFRLHLRDELANDADLTMMQVDDAGCAYEVRGSVLEYRRGSGFLRFMIGLGAGSAKVVTELRLIDLSDDRTVFAGNFEGTVASWTESGAEMYKRVAKDFRKALRKSCGLAAESAADRGRGL